MQERHLDQATEHPFPVYKVGAVVLRAGTGGTEILIVQPKPKQSGEIPPFVLPRGSRQYWQEEAGQRRTRDVRDAATAQQHAERLEPLVETLRREIHEEAGIGPEALAAAEVRELGAMPFHSRSKGIYPIHWFMVLPDLPAQAAMAEALPSDAMALRWATPAMVKTLTAEGNFSAGYWPVIEHALQVFADKRKA